MKKLIIGILVVVGSAALILPKFLGSQGTKMHNDFFQEQAQQLVPGVIVESEEMDNGWFNSEGQHRVKLSKTILKKMIPGIKSIELEKDIDLVVNTKFHHGPFAFTSFGTKGSAFSPVLAVAESTLKIDNNGELTDIPGKLFTQVNTTGSGGKAKYLIEEYSHKSDDAQIDFDGLELNFDISDKGEMIDGNGESGKLSIIGDNGEKIVLNKMRFDADLDNNSGLWFGDSALKFGDFTFDNGKGVTFVFEDVDIAGANTGNADTMQSAVKFSIGEFVLSDMKFEDFTFDYSMDNLDTQALATIQQNSKNARGHGNMTSTGPMMDAFKSIIAKSPTLNINEFSVKTPEGKVQADLKLGLPKEVDTAFFPLSLLPQIQGDANIRIPKGVLEMLESVKPGIANQAEMMEQFGMLELKGNDYIAVLKMREGKMTVNGNEVPMLDMLF